MQNAIVVGVDGFLGRAVARKLSSRGTNVIGVTRRARGPRIPGVRHVAAQLDDPQAVADALRETRGVSATVTFHMAGMSSASDCERAPLDALRANVTTLTVVLEALRSLQLSRVVFPSTGLVYGQCAASPVAEDAPTSPTTVYGATKLAAEAILSAYTTSFGFASAVARLSTVYGADASPETVVGRLLGQARARTPLHVRTARPVRDFIYVDDVAEGLIALADSLDGPGSAVYNVSSGRPVTVGELARELASEAGMSGDIAETDPESPGAFPGLVLSNLRIRNEVGWQPRYTLRSGIAAALKHSERAVE
jgi:nucleoside-diphosphate-sugar epimerase